MAVPDFTRPQPETVISRYMICVLVRPASAALHRGRSGMTTAMRTAPGQDAPSDGEIPTSGGAPLRGRNRFPGDAAPEATDLVAQGPCSHNNGQLLPSRCRNQ